MSIESTLNVEACEDERFDDDLPFDEVNTCRSEFTVAFVGGDLVAANDGLGAGFRVRFEPDFAFAVPAAIAGYCPCFFSEIGDESESDRVIVRRTD